MCFWCAWCVFASTRCFLVDDVAAAVAARWAGNSDSSDETFWEEKKERREMKELPARQERVCTAGSPNSSGPVFFLGTLPSLSLSTLHSLSSTRKEHVSLSFSLYSSTFLSFSLHSDDIHLFSSFLSERKIKIKHFLLFSLTRFWAVCCCFFFFFYIHVIRKVDLYAERKSSVSPSSFLSVCNNGQHTRLVCVCRRWASSRRTSSLFLIRDRQPTDSDKLKLKRGGRDSTREEFLRLFSFSSQLFKRTEWITIAAAATIVKLSKSR